MLNPRPVPPKVRVVLSSPCVKRSKMVFSLFLGIPIPVSLTENLIE